MGSGPGARYTLVIGLKQGQRVSGGGLLGKGDGGAQGFAGWIRPFSLGQLEGLGRAPILPLPLVGGVSDAPWWGGREQLALPLLGCS